MDPYGDHIRDGYVRLQGGDVDGAIAAICAAIALDPERALGHRALAEVLLEAGRVLEAASEARIAMHADPADPVAVEILGAALLGAMRAKDAVDVFEHGLQRHPEHLAFFLNAAAARRALGDPEPALRHAENARALAPGSPEVLLELGRTYVEVDRLDDASGAFSQAEAHPSTRLDASAERANLSFLLGDLDDAETRARAILAEDPSHRLAIDVCAAASAARLPIVGAAWRKVVARGSYGAMGTQASVAACAAIGAAAGGLLVPGAIVGAAAISYFAGITYTRYYYDQARARLANAEG